MKTGDIIKLDLYFVGARARFEQNIDYFLNIECTFKSGKKTVTAKFAKNDDVFTLKYNGTSKDCTIDELFVFFKEECVKYETSEFNLHERGNTMQILCTIKGVSMKQFETKVVAKESANPLLKDREYLINIDKARDLLKAIGILTKDYKLKNDMIRKYNQIDRFVELIAPMYENETGDILILDCACGKSYLSFVMNYYLREVLKKKCRIIGIDYSEQVIKESNRIKKELNYNNMEFIQADLYDYVPPQNITGVISLHACDVATDLALGVAVRGKAKYISCVPCCHKELLGQYEIEQFKPVLKHGILAARFNDILTDGLRVLKLEAYGYKVNMMEYISPLDTPKNLLIRAVLEKNSNKKAAEEYDNIVNTLGIYPQLIELCKNQEDSF
ncbi:MAG: SAM-dependent methyltransferase [Clostridia bacterium]